jgi:hypothetical protein
LLRPPLYESPLGIKGALLRAVVSTPGVGS